MQSIKFSYGKPGFRRKNILDRWPLDKIWTYEFNDSNAFDFVFPNEIPVDGLSGNYFYIKLHQVFSYKPGGIVPQNNATNIVFHYADNSSIQFQKTFYTGDHGSDPYDINNCYKYGGVVAERQIVPSHNNGYVLNHIYLKNLSWQQGCHIPQIKGQIFF